MVEELGDIFRQEEMQSFENHTIQYMTFSEGQINSLHYVLTQTSFNNEAPGRWLEQIMSQRVPFTPIETGCQHGGMLGQWT